MRVGVLTMEGAPVQAHVCVVGYAECVTVHVTDECETTSDTLLHEGGTVYPHVTVRAVATTSVVTVENKL